VTVEKHATDGGTLQAKVQYEYDALGDRFERDEDADGNGTYARSSGSPMMVGKCIRTMKIELTLLIRSGKSKFPRSPKKPQKNTGHPGIQESPS
jgi:hypothetical protein